jgi:SAM-dependent methyltransferase
LKVESKEHWQSVYQSKGSSEVSWYQEFPNTSFNLIKETNLKQDQAIIDVGAGASTLIDALVDEGFKDLTVVDISERSLQYAQERLGGFSKKINWITADVTEYKFQRKYDFWHDRAVFHFLTDLNARGKYKQALDQALAVNSYLIIATFALDGPTKCSGLEVESYDAMKLQIELGDKFSLIKSIDENHLTPWEAEQKFTYCLFEKVSA